MTYTSLILLLLTASTQLVGCAKGEDSGSPYIDNDTTTEETDWDSSSDESSGCDVVEVDFDGDDPPLVGTTWTLFPRCDGALVMGAVVIRVEPLEAATLDENLITFAQPGLCEISIQVGSQVGTLEVEVME